MPFSERSIVKKDGFSTHFGKERGLLIVFNSGYQLFFSTRWGIKLSFSKIVGTEQHRDSPSVWVAISTQLAHGRKDISKWDVINSPCITPTAFHNIFNFIICNISLYIFYCNFAEVISNNPCNPFDFQSISNGSKASSSKSF